MNNPKSVFMSSQSLRFKRFSILSAFLALILGIFLVSCESLGEIGTLLADDDDSTVAAIGQSLSSISKVGEEITPENEYYIGRSVAAAISTTYPIYKNAPKTTEYLNEICNALVVNSSMPFLYKGYYVAIIDTDEINAMATPGGHIFVSRGLIKRTNSEDSLAAVIAHEISHIQLKHSISAIKSSRFTNAVTKSTRAGALVAADAIASQYEDSIDKFGISYDELIQSADELLAAQEEIVSTLVTSGFSREQEFQADSQALALMADSGYDPNAMLDMLSLISGNTNTGGWNQTHPSPADRIKNVNKKLSGIKFKGKDKAVRQKRFTEMTSDL